MCFALSGQVLMNLLESWVLLGTSCWIQTTFVYYIHLHWTILTPLIIPLCNSYCLRNLSQKNCLHKLSAPLSAKNGTLPLGPAKCATKGAGKSKERGRISWIESGFAWVEAFYYMTNRTHDIKLTFNIGLHVSGLSFGFSGSPCFLINGTKIWENNQRKFWKESDFEMLSIRSDSFFWSWFLRQRWKYTWEGLAFQALNLGNSTNFVFFGWRNGKEGPLEW